MAKYTKKEYDLWQGMVRRCTNPGHSAYKKYGAKGITVCQEWIDSIDAFYEHMGPKPFEGATLDRIDNSLGYFPENVRWATARQQARNKSTNRVVEYKGQKMLLCEAAELAGIKLNIVTTRIWKGWSVERALNTPVKKRKSKGGLSLPTGDGHGQIKE